MVEMYHRLIDCLIQCLQTFEKHANAPRKIISAFALRNRFIRRWKLEMIDVGIEEYVGGKHSSSRPCGVKH